MRDGPETMAYFFDTYAFIAYFIEGRESYKKYFENPTGDDSTSILSLMEMYSRVYHAEGLEISEEILQNILNNFDVVVLNDVSVIRDAGIFRSKMLKEKKKLSYTDCVNYILSQRKNQKLLTGDRDFEDIKGVEYVK
ncbi:MAG: PIN domain-containing protein [Candidatus Altiarchaeota archaeon]